eukprot:gnl/TRDRNA2_/TRDRNA2_188161_c0_seq1.p1 gnl/TRDRNA2_/TRDRNA2_188161_c0~~gnl/TRDRNA2_/TRDRNA2_188161_c0_seq1.p1  ORF type:complete len:937 (-),score=186.10 gnl/TRDRNA2_/TRDRNA2_188161_c0_seq1:122-2581(-)
MGAAPSAAEDDAPIKEGDFVQFQVQKSTEGYPQALNARRFRRLHGQVLSPPHGPRHSGESEESKEDDDIVEEAGTIVIKDFPADSPEAAGTDENLRRLIGKKVRVQQVDCGQLWLAPGDEVGFCCVGSEETQLEAQLVELVSTSRQAGSLLGCFMLELPRPPMVEETPKEKKKGDKAEKAEQLEKEKQRLAEALANMPPPPVVVLDGHALADRVVLAGLPEDLGVPELMRLFSKLGATEAVTTHPDTGGQKTQKTGYASISFGGPVDVARVLVRAAHTINEQGATFLARLGAPRLDGGAMLPALPRPALIAADGGKALHMQWSQVGLAIGYEVELRTAAFGAAERGPWTKVATSGDGGVTPSSSSAVSLAVRCQRLPKGLFGAQVSACRLSGLQGDTAYEARIMYFSASGFHSEPSSASAPCTCVLGEKDGGASTPTAVATPVINVAVAAASTAAPSNEASFSPAAAALFKSATAAAPTAASAAPTGQAPHATWPETVPPPAAAENASTAPAPVQASASPPQWQQYQQLLLPSPPQEPVPTQLPLPGMSAGWRCPHGAVVPAPPPPELVPLNEAGWGICVQWPTVVHATAYTVELLDQGTNAAERFTRAVPERLTEALVELRVGGLNPGSYAACVRCVAPCGCESAPSAWSALPAGCPPYGSHPYGVPGLGGLGYGWDTCAGLSQHHQPAYVDARASLLSTTPPSTGADAWWRTPHEGQSLASMDVGTVPCAAAPMLSADGLIVPQVELVPGFLPNPQEGVVATAAPATPAPAAAPAAAPGPATSGPAVAMTGPATPAPAAPAPGSAPDDATDIALMLD